MSLKTSADVANPPAGGHGAVIMAIREHHVQMAEQLGARTAAVLAAVRAGDCTDARDELHDWYRTELMPHVVAEERALYAPASDVEATRLLIQGMLAEHRFLVGLIAELALAVAPLTVATIETAAEAVFAIHVDKENVLLLPALEQAGLDLGAALEGMHEMLGNSECTEPGHSCGGCDCSVVTTGVGISGDA